MASDGDVLVLWVVYDHPSDFPKHFVVRRHFVKADAHAVLSRELAPHGTIAGSDPRVEIDRGAVLATTLDAARGMLPRGLTRIPRAHGDDPCVSEVWL